MCDVFLCFKKTKTLSLPLPLVIFYSHCHEIELTMSDDSRVISALSAAMETVPSSHHLCSLGG